MNSKVGVAVHIYKEFVRDLAATSPKLCKELFQQ